jgi:xanthine dehydrogenase accessory factor
MALADIVPSVAKAVGEGTAAVVVTILVDRTGAISPAGSRMLVAHDGRRVGSISPGLDTAFAGIALEALSRQRGQLRSYRLRDGTLDDVGVTGGDLDVFYDVLERPARLVIVGAGHIAVPLARFGKLLDQEVIVLDDRPEFANRERFPEADEIMVGPYRETVSRLPIHTDTAIVLVTRGHVHDQACLEEVLDSPATYVGMIGSKRRVRTVFQHLVEAGRDPELLRRVHAPVGLDINARTPAEIALSVMAEIVKVRRGGTARSLAIGDKIGG